MDLNSLVELLSIFLLYRELYLLLYMWTIEWNSLTFCLVCCILMTTKQVHHVLVDIVSAAANGTPGLGRYPPFKREVYAF